MAGVRARVCGRHHARPDWKCPSCRQGEARGGSPPVKAPSESCWQRLHSLPPPPFPTAADPPPRPPIDGSQSHPTPCSGGADQPFRHNLFGRRRDSTFSPLAGLRPVPRPSTPATSNGLPGQHAPAAVDTGAGRRAEKWVPHLSLWRPNPAPPRPTSPHTNESPFPCARPCADPPAHVHTRVCDCVRAHCLYSIFSPQTLAREEMRRDVVPRAALVVGPAGALHPSRLGRGGAADPAPLAASPVLPRPRCS
jgi:hypothetical protein